MDLDPWEINTWRSTEADGGSRHHGHLMLALIHTLLALWAGLANITQIVTVLQDEKLRRQPRSALIVSISVSELLVALFLCPLYTDSLVRGPWRHGLLLCSMYEAVFYLQVCVSSLAVLMFNVERFYFMAAPHLLQSPSRRCHANILLTSLPWLLGVLVMVPLFKQGTQTTMEHVPGLHHRTCIVQWDPSLHIVTVFISFLAPSFLMLATAVSVLLLYVLFSVRAHHEETSMDSGASSLQSDHQWSSHSDAENMNSQGGTRRRRHFSGLQDLHWKFKKECVLSVCVSTFVSVGLQFPFFILLLLQEFCQQQPSDSSAFSLLPESSSTSPNDPSNCQFSDMVWATCMVLGMAKSGLLPLVWLVYSDIRAGFSPKVCSLWWRRWWRPRGWWSSLSSSWSVRRQQNEDGAFESEAGYTQSRPSLSSQMTIV